MFLLKIAVPVVAFLFPLDSSNVSSETIERDIQQQSEQSGRPASTPAPNKERPFIPGLERPGLSGPFSVSALSQELVRFDLQKMEHPETSGVAYQQGTLFGYEVREYCLEKWGRACAYCGATGVPLQLEHILARAKGGSRRVSNLTLACEPCNRKKGTQDLRAFLAQDPVRLERILTQAKTPLQNATAVNVTRWELFRRLKATGLPAETGSGGWTKYNRARLALPKTHWLDAAAVGASTPEQLRTAHVIPLLVQAMGRGHRRLCNVDKLGFLVSHRKPHKRYFGYQTGDLVRAVVPERFACRGTQVGRAAVKACGCLPSRRLTGRSPMRLTAFAVCNV